MSSIADMPSLFARCVQLGLACIPREYPHASQGMLLSAADVRTPRELWPVFFGCYDWHSAVHNHWQLVRALRVMPGAPWAGDAAALLSSQLQPEKLTREAEYLDRFVGFEMPYGIAWLLTLCAEVEMMARTDAILAEQARGWGAGLAPLHAIACRNTIAYWRALVVPNRAGAHANTAFAAGLMLDAVRLQRAAQSGGIEDAIRAYFDRSVRVAPRIDIHAEPLGYDFISPSLCEADLASRLMDEHVFRAWVTQACVHVRNLQPPVPARPEDGQQSHFDGLNISRAWMLRRIASRLRSDDAWQADLLRAADAHAAAGLSGASHLHYSGQHWLGSFAMYLLTMDWNAADRATT